MYQDTLAKIELKEQSAKRIDTLFIVAKVATFLLFAWLGYLFFSREGRLFLIGSIAFLAMYVLAVYYDAKHARLMAHWAAMKAFVLQEQAYLLGDVSTLPTGNEYINRKHEYALDLDIFGTKSLFQAVNRTVTLEGRNKLSRWMQTSDTETAEILERQAAIKELIPMVDWRLNYQAIGRQVQLSATRLLELSAQSIAKPMAKYPSSIYWLARAFTAITLASLALAVMGVWGSNIFFCLAFAQLCMAASFTKPLNKIAAQLGGMQKGFAKYHELLAHFCTQEFNSERIKKLQGAMGNRGREARVLKAFNQLGQITDGLDRRSNIFGNIVFNGLMMHDIYLIRAYRKWVDTYAAEIPLWIETLSDLDALSSLANFSCNHPLFTWPIPDTSTLVSAKDMGHPLIARDKVVCNDFEMQSMHQFVIVTGANMAGKSTFLRTVGVNLVLAASGAPVCASYFHFTPMQLFSSMRAADNLSDDTSYFKAELVRLRDMIDCISTKKATFVILDEILKGTNSLDKLKGSRLFLERLIRMPAAGIIATHDLALGDMEQEHAPHFSNACFEIHTNDGQIRYDYKLQPGVTQNLNATQLIQEMLLDW